MCNKGRTKPLGQNRWHGISYLAGDMANAPVKHVRVIEALKCRGLSCRDRPFLFRMSVSSVGKTCTFRRQCRGWCVPSQATIYVRMAIVLLVTLEDELVGPVGSTS